MLHRIAVLIATALLATVAQAAEPPANVRVYAFDCGRIEFKDLGNFSPANTTASPARLPNLAS